MEEQLIELETAKLAYDKGLRRRGQIIKEEQTFKINLDGIKCNTCFNLQGNPTTPKYVNNNQQYVRPTQSLLQKWLREKHNIYVESYHDLTADGKSIQYYTSWGFIQSKDINGNKNVNGWYDEYNNWKTYEEALEFGLQEGLKLIQE